MTGVVDQARTMAEGRLAKALPLRWRHVEQGKRRDEPEAVLQQLDGYFTAEVRDAKRSEASGYEMTMYAAEFADAATSRRVNGALTHVGMPPRREVGGIAHA